MNLELQLLSQALFTASLVLHGYAHNPAITSAEVDTELDAIAAKIAAVKGGY